MIIYVCLSKSSWKLPHIVEKKRLMKRIITTYKQNQIQEFQRFKIRILQYVRVKNDINPIA
jgi:hypothetical protein